MNLRKIGLSVATIFAAVLVLTGCAGSSSPNTAIITMKGHQIQVTDLYNEATIFPNLPASSLLQQATLSWIFEKEFGKQVSSSDVTKAYKETAEQYGSTSSFESALAAQGLTTAGYQAQIRLQLLQEKAVDKEVAATQYTQANLKAAWKTYYPQVDTYIAASSSQSNAQQTQSLAKSNSSEFISQAKDKNLEQKFDSSNTSIPSEVQDAAIKLKNGQVSDVIKVTDSSGDTNYYVIYMISNPGKGSDMSKYTSQLKNYIKSQKENDTSFVASVVKDYLTKYDVTVKANAFSNIFQNYTGIE